MFHRLMTLLEGRTARSPGPAGPDPLQRATAVLFVLAASIDGRIDARERETVARLLQVRLGVDDPATLLDEAEPEAAASIDVFSLTRVISERLPPEERPAIIEMLWEVVLADGETHDYEANLVRRAAGLLHVDDREAGAARKRVLQRSREGDGRRQARTAGTGLTR